MPTLGLHAFPIDPARYRRFFSEGVVLWPVAAMADPLPSVKHRSRLRWWLADQALRADATAPAGALALPCENDGSPTETAVGSLLLVVGDRLITPAPPDVLESVSVGVVAEIAPSCGLVWERRPLSRDDVAVASEALLTGTAFGLAGVRQLGLRVYEWPGPRTLALQQAWGQFTGVHPATEFATEP
jgi:branched-subunit amino acid aminotransferase/4-amino-4-deoxychorismate lyase